MDKHYKPEFIKHVFPKFYNPVIPLFEPGVKISFKSLFMISSNLVPLFWESSDISNSFVSSCILGVVRGYNTHPLSSDLHSTMIISSSAIFTSSIFCSKSCSLIFKGVASTLTYV